MVKLLLIILKVKDLMRIHNKNSVTDKEFWMFLPYTKQDNKVNQKISDIIINIMINCIFKEDS